MIRVSFSIGASADVVTFSQFVATGETICVRGAPVRPFSAATGTVVFAPPVIALSPLQLVGELLDGGGERLVGVGELTDCLYQALYGVVFSPWSPWPGCQMTLPVFCDFFTHLLLGALVSDFGVFCEAGLAGCELAQLLDVADRCAEIFLGWRPLAFCCGLLLPC